MFKIKMSKKIIDGPFIIPLLCAVSFVVIAIVALASSLFVSNLENPINCIGIAAMITLIVSGMIFGVICEKLSGAIQSAFITIGIVGAVIIVFSFIFGNMLGGILNALCFAGMGIISVIVSKSLSEKKRHRR